MLVSRLALEAETGTYADAVERIILETVGVLDKRTPAAGVAVQSQAEAAGAVSVILPADVAGIIGHKGEAPGGDAGKQAVLDSVVLPCKTVLPAEESAAEAGPDFHYVTVLEGP